MKKPLGELEESVRLELYREAGITFSEDSAYSIGLKDDQLISGYKACTIKDFLISSKPHFLFIEVFATESREVEPPLKIFQIRLYNHVGMWPESFASAEKANAFLRGLQAGASMFGHMITLVPELRDQ